MNRARSPVGTSSAAISLAKLVALTQAISSLREGARHQLCDRCDVALAHVRRAQGEVAQEARLAHGEDVVELAEQARQQSRADMADVEDPARVVPQLADIASSTVGHGTICASARLLEQPVVEEACSAISVAVHGDEPHHARRRVERLGEPRGIAGDFVGGRSAGHGAH